jgi:hypothetical protein
MQQKERNALFARVFRGADGEKALAYLQGLNKPSGPTGLDALKLAHTEGQRNMAQKIADWVRQGREQG